MSADFEGAIATLEAALGGTLPLEDAESALDRLAAARSAIGDDAGVESALGRLAVVAPSHLFAPDVPTEISQRFVAIMLRTPRVAVEIVRDPTSTPGSSAAPSAPRMVVHDDPWHAVVDTALQCAPTEHGERCEALAYGPGHVVVARAQEETTRPPDPSSGPDPLVLGLGIGGGVLVVALVIGIAVGVAGSGGGGGGGRLQLDAPIIHW